MSLSLAAASVSFTAPMAPRGLAASQVSMKAPGEIGVTPPLGVYDPLNLLATPVEYPRRSYERYVELEIKHGRIAMLACLGIFTTEAGFRWPGYLSKSLDLKFSDIPGGALDSYAAVPAIGWLQIVAFIVILELGYGATPPGNAPGDVGGPSWIRYSDPEVKTFKLNVSRARPLPRAPGRAAAAAGRAWLAACLAGGVLSMCCRRHRDRRASRALDAAAATRARDGSGGAPATSHARSPAARYRRAPRSSSPRC